ncbi:o-succinylbenzoate--CoA ligase [Corynebacterium sp. 153RC1]|uniref:o-succinylbenzoate--CoA ligase n=1 Tax=unclassified Corynebacterium TaxID=2624378 RepID=UPI00211CD980|nr:o-succinylbenzoate--CoA ligase [Corynebacterium sp. 209RC1]MCQ9354528.1 o-succinylbenzoate--CoA ligase [Corynebacterium sp. 1222RC1]MCQ9356074.1 o-succinylbenzoate--CoA ligase [Corynebacterium sp. 122RC1]MCQ9358706.1 o-succinylbenzoate--CoA ligase [Corynebacterium sp. 142RC1]MCQ9360688.1 o-succinylbenzoate--CoA ligase [Corynebacterium sp. 153RC1]MCQ9363212.1 o-succinylbenzoate--CoA ligase [Corynebacterium sp. 732RC1]MCQ9364515.1 o-succinylbenzoate--CoA ligase [Corynebacterium sp. 70RC1]MC
MILEPLRVSSNNLAAVLDALEEAIAGKRSLLPVPAHDPARADLLRRTQRAGSPIDEDVALVVPTSGSTGTPKGAMLTARNLVASADATHQRLGGEGQWLLAMPADHIAGLQVLVRSLISGFTPAALDVSAGFHIPAFSLAAQELAAEPHTGRLYTSLAPLQLLKAMDTLEGIEALRVFDAVLVGGAPLRAADRLAAAELGIHVVTTYGSSETAGGCVYDGVPLPGVRVRVAGERIFLGGPMVAKGYRNLPNHEAFSEPGWFATSDTGAISDGTLEVTGRLDTVIVTGGLKLHPEVVERTVQAVPGVRGVCVVGVSDARFGQAVCLAYEGTATPADIIEALDEYPRWQLPKQILKVDALPLAGPGKVDRKKVAGLF